MIARDRYTTPNKSRLMTMKFYFTQKVENFTPIHPARNKHSNRMSHRHDCD